MRAILVLALALRLGVVWMVLFRYPRNWLFSKSPDLGFLAHSLVSGHGLCSPFGGSTGPTAFLAPGYPAVLGLVFRLFGSYSFVSGAVMMGLQTLFAVLTVAIIMPSAQDLRRARGQAGGNVLGGFAASHLAARCALGNQSVHPAFDRHGCTRSALRDKPGAGLWAAMGAYCGLAMLVNPSLMLALFAIVGWTV